MSLLFGAEGKNACHWCNCNL